MLPKLDERKRAIELRKKGLSYSEILKIISVSKSTLSRWLPERRLTKPQIETLKRKLSNAQRLGGIARHRQRIERTEEIIKKSSSEIKRVDLQNLFYMGVMLYWAEGAKQRVYVSQGVDFSNSDPDMNKLFIKWLRLCLKIPKQDILLTIYIHESKKENIDDILNYWSKVTGFTKENFTRTCYTRTIYPRKHKRREIKSYHGQLRIRVKKSTDLNRKIVGWVKGICFKSGELK